MKKSIRTYLEAENYFSQFLKLTNFVIHATMKKLIFSFALLYSSIILFAQKDYFQQEVNYKIECQLNDEEHILTGNIEIEYFNNAPDDLDFIYMHLWANAFKNIETAFAKQKRRTGSTRFYFAKDNQFGYYDSLDFKVDGQPVEWVYDEEHPDIAKLNLKAPLKSGNKLTISTPFLIKIPASFSRLGHVKTSYQMTQWYPKPAVYDKDGWHPMPYLDIGEFYSEFGAFDVKITLPENYVVGATGELQNDSEKAFLLKKAEETEAFFDSFLEKLTNAEEAISPSQFLLPLDTFPASSTKLKTLHYTAENVHDFAWFADKRFHVQKGDVTLASGKKIDTWTMFPHEEADLWHKSIEYVNRSVKFYSDKVGEYPWPHATAVHSALSAGGGMEYPMITVIGNSGTPEGLDDVITHEVGHNWFYGILASNERDHPWIDEGVNSYYEYRYMTENYGSRGEVFDLPKLITKGSKIDIQELGYLFMARRGIDQAPETHSNKMSTMNYGIGAYAKPGMVFGHLEAYLGTAPFDGIMQSFYEKWKFKHPGPKDLRVHFEEESGKDLTWFFDGYINSTAQLDYAISGINTEGKYEIEIQNKGSINAPFPVSGIKDDKIIETRWFEGFEGKKALTFPLGEYDKVVIDAEHKTLEINRRNNNYKTKGVLKSVEPFRLHWLGSFESSDRSTLYWTPLPLYNVYDGFMPALAFYNTTVPSRKLEYFVMPAYSFKTKEVTGMADLRFNVFPKSGLFQKITLGANLKSFNVGNRDSLRTVDGYASTDLKYVRVASSIKFDFRKAATSNFHQSIQFRNIWINEERTSFADGNYVGDVWVDYSINELSYKAMMKRALNPFGFKISLERLGFENQVGINEFEKTNSFKVALEFKSSYTYARKRSVDVRIFAGKFFKNPFENRALPVRNMLNLTKQGFNDYSYDNVHFGRNEPDGFWSRQIYLQDGGMKAAFGNGMSFAGRSNVFIFAVNLKADLPQNLPLNLPLKPYLDFGYFNDGRPVPTYESFNERLWWSGGFMLDFFNGTIGVYFPVINSKNGIIEVSGDPDPNGLRKLYEGRGNYWNRITFSIDFHRLNPRRIINSISL